MRKLAALLLALALIPASFALAEEPDFITTYNWYIDMDMESSPELQAVYPNYRHITCVLTFTPDGLIYNLENDISKDSSADRVAYNVAGRWEATAGGYKLNLIGLGEGSANIQAGALYAEFFGGNGVFFLFRPMVRFDLYKDVTYK